MKSLMKLRTSIILAIGMTFWNQMSGFAQNTPATAGQPAVYPAQSLSQLGSGRVMNLTPTDAQGHSVHIMPTKQMARTLGATGNLTPTPPLTYHGGPIMGSITIYNIFWVGALQGGGTAPLTSLYMNTTNNLATDYAGHSLDTINTQYYQTLPSKFVHGLTINCCGSSLGGIYIDTNPFPHSYCTDTATPNNCIADVQLRNEILTVLAATGWKGGGGNMFVVYTGQGEGSCTDAGSSKCAYSYYCGYHSFFTPAGANTIMYANIPYAGVNSCEVPSAPNGDLGADSAANVASHEISEAITDPHLNAWYNSDGNENGDLCAFDFGTNTYNIGMPNEANQQWNGNNYLLQREWNNHTGSCVQVGP